MKLGRFLFLLLGVLCLVSCKESEKERIARLVNEWEGKEILFPQNPIFTIQGKDTVDFDFLNSEYKIVTYVDSTGCTGCKLQLPRWKEFMTEVDSLMNNSIPFIFVFHPKNVKELRHTLRNYSFNYPVCFDEMDDFNKLNRFPSDMTFQTFLLDGSNRVVAIGNPILNPNVKKLYLKTLMGAKQQEETPVTEVSVSETEYDFGTFPMTEKQEHVFRMKNKGHELLVIHDVVTSCGCTKVEYSKKPVRPGEELELNVIYEAEENGRFNKTLTVYCNVKDSPIRLRIKGSAE